MTTEFDDIRPYHDDEVRPTLDRILADPELIDAVARLKFPRLNSWAGGLLRPLVKRALVKQLAGVNSVRGFQDVVEKYMARMIRNTTSALTVSGLEHLDPQQAYLFISNHRDIAMDPAFVNWSLYHSDCNTLRIAIGDNLLTKPYVSDLMRLNKSFIVNRSAKAPREKLKAAKHLSAYIYHSIVNENSNIWIAQREGRAKDGHDKTNSAVIGMLTINRPKTQEFSDYVKALHIVPVSISYEFDPCDAAKARELYHQRTSGSYQKEQHEDVKSIAMGIAGQKGHVHIAFGEVLKEDYMDADEVVAEIDRQVLSNYVLHSSNCFAYQMLHGTVPKVNYSDKNVPFVPEKLGEQRQQFELRMQAIPTEYRELVLAMYANPVLSKLQD
ncbi:1-acyl-sn-glycerol-3-phosphate acyltransferase [Cellvibrio sp. PSBB006]|uniref:1-acyl-sn-glycerol-3-phosphate acyltransferase n=1 Tax=Cellvibrio sp. PSBB006 TaxID=1987723 RepID=UPI000B3B1855|nr:1-acyl-sn-glycerol-3-phosphate acyltransferase [Cellvibrio sp. PSBB006]ARU29695.1 cytochrome C oxidase Cbb3 [Cellvibrio sp. PSBB006]